MTSPRRTRRAHASATRAAAVVQVGEQLDAPAQRRRRARASAFAGSAAAERDAIERPQQLDDAARTVAVRGRSKTSATAERVVVRRRLEDSRATGLAVRCSADLGHDVKLADSMA